MPIIDGALKIIDKVAQAGNTVLEHHLKPAAEKVKDIRFKDLLTWRKHGEESDERAEKRKERADKIRRDIGVD